MQKNKLVIIWKLIRNLLYSNPQKNTTWDTQKNCS